MTQSKVYINDSCYVSTTEESSSRCSDCHIDMYETYADCRKIQDSHNGCRGIIWIKQQPAETQATTRKELKGESEMTTASKPTEVTTEEPKYTLAEFLESYYAYISDKHATLATRDEFISKYLLRFSSQEYHEYLRLKAKFD